MKFAVIVYEHETELAKRSGPGKQEYWAGWMAYQQALEKAGIMCGGAGLQPPESSTFVRNPATGLEVQDGPFADSKEQLGGFLVFEVASREEAVHWASRCPAARAGRVEIRPVLPPLSECQ